MKILLVIENLRSCGKQRRIVELLKGFVNIKEVNCELVILSQKIHYNEITNLNLKIHITERRWKKDPLIISELYKICKKFKPDIVHTWGSMSGVYILPVVKLLRIKWVNSMITNATPLKILGENWTRSKLTFPFSDIILANSYAGIKAYKVCDKKAYVIHNGFNFDRIKNLKDKSEIKIKFKINTPYVVGMVGAFDSRKDYKTLIEAAHAIILKRDDITFILVGNGKKLKDCKDLVPVECKDRILFTGQQTDVESIINIFDIGILMTNDNRHREGISNSIMEYMALQKPVIATYGGGTDEIVIHEQTGFLIKSFDKKALINNIEYLINNPIVIKEIGLKGKERIINEFSIDKMINKTIELYKKVLVK